MNKVLSGKKLLILGASHSEIFLVNRAKELGIYTIVTDYRTDRNTVKAKNFADEAWDVSWTDLDTLEKLCRENNIDGVIGGWSEILVEQVALLCERLNFPCYTTLKQLDITRNKRKFKNECIRNGVPTVREYNSIDEVDKFPVIIKPVDRAGSIGISVANNYNELVKAYNYAMELSICKDVIIEEFISDAKKIDTYYNVINGEIFLISSNDVINAKNNGLEKIVQSGWVLPSRYHSVYAEKIDESVKRMIHNMGIKNGTLFFSGFANDSGYFAMFETGFRLDGGYLQEYFVKKGLINPLDIYLYHSLTGDTSALNNGKDLSPNLKCATVNIYAKSGVISKIEGFDTVKNMKNCDLSFIQARIGMECEDDKAILSKIGMCYFCSESTKELANDVKEAYKHIKVSDADGNDMIFDRIDENCVLNNWK